MARGNIQVVLNGFIKGNDISIFPEEDIISFASIREEIDASVYHELLVQAIT